MKRTLCALIVLAGAYGAYANWYNPLPPEIQHYLENFENLLSVNLNDIHNFLPLTSFETLKKLVSEPWITSDRLLSLLDLLRKVLRQICELEDGFSDLVLALENEGVLMGAVGPVGIEHPLGSIWLRHDGSGTAIFGFLELPRGYVVLGISNRDPLCPVGYYMPNPEHNPTAFVEVAILPHTVLHTHISLDGQSQRLPYLAGHTVLNINGNLVQIRYGVLNPSFTTSGSIQVSCGIGAGEIVELGLQGSVGLTLEVPLGEALEVIGEILDALSTELGQIEPPLTLEEATQMLVRSLRGIGSRLEELDGELTFEVGGTSSLSCEVGDTGLTLLGCTASIGITLPYRDALDLLPSFIELASTELQLYLVPLHRLVEFVTQGRAPVEAWGATIADLAEKGRELCDVLQPIWTVLCEKARLSCTLRLTALGTEEGTSFKLFSAHAETPFHGIVDLYEAVNGAFIAIARLSRETLTTVAGREVEVFTEEEESAPLSREILLEFVRALPEDTSLELCVALPTSEEALPFARFIVELPELRGFIEILLLPETEGKTRELLEAFSRCASSGGLRPLLEVLESPQARELLGDAKVGIEFGGGAELTVGAEVSGGFGFGANVDLITSADFLVGLLQRGIRGKADLSLHVAGSLSAGISLGEGVELGGGLGIGLEQEVFSAEISTYTAVPLSLPFILVAGFPVIVASEDENAIRGELLLPTGGRVEATVYKDPAGDTLGIWSGNFSIGDWDFASVSGEITRRGLEWGYEVELGPSQGEGHFVLDCNGRLAIEGSTLVHLYPFDVEFRLGMESDGEIYGEFSGSLFCDGITFTDVHLRLDGSGLRGEGKLPLLGSERTFSFGLDACGNIRAESSFSIQLLGQQVTVTATFSAAEGLRVRGIFTLNVPGVNVLSSIYREQLQVGNYVSHDIHGPYTGLMSENGEIIGGRWDVPEAFDLPEHVNADFLWFTYGWIKWEYPLDIPEDAEITSLEYIVEVASECCKANWNWPSNLTVSINDVEIGGWTIPGDPDASLGVAKQENHLSPELTQYGWLTSWIVDKGGTHFGYRFRLGDKEHGRISDVTIDDLGLSPGGRLSLKLSIPPSGGLNIFGDTWGDYDQDPTLVVKYKVSGNSLPFHLTLGSDGSLSGHFQGDIAIGDLVIHNVDLSLNDQGINGTGEVELLGQRVVFDLEVSRDGRITGRAEAELEIDLPDGRRIGFPKASLELQGDGTIEGTGIFEALNHRITDCTFTVSDNLISGSGWVRIGDSGMNASFTLSPTGWSVEGKVEKTVTVGGLMFELNVSLKASAGNIVAIATGTVSGNFLDQKVEMTISREVDLETGEIEFEILGEGISIDLF